MMKLAIFLAAVCFWNHGSARRLTKSTFDNEVDNSLDRLETNERVVKSWVKINQSQDKEVRVNFGDSVELVCEASGKPPPLIQWYDERDQLTSNEIISNTINPYELKGLAKTHAKLLIDSAEHTKTYFCKAQSGIKIAKSQTRVVVSNRYSNRIDDEIRELKPKSPKDEESPRIVFYNTIYMENIGNSVELPCKASGTPAPDTLWLDPAERVIPENSIRFEILPSGGLRINRIIWDDMGPYTCVVKNTVGQDSVTTFLYPLRPEK